MVARHNKRERRLFADLSTKNTLSRELRRLAQRMRRWQERRQKIRSRRRRAAYLDSLQRGGLRLEKLRSDVLSRNEDLRLRIQEEFDISEKEIQDFEEPYRKEAQEARTAQAELDEKRRALESAPSDPPGDAEKAARALSELERSLRRAERRARKETKDVEKVKDELASEAQDREILEFELRRIVAEVEALRQRQT